LKYTIFALSFGIALIDCYCPVDKANNISPSGSGFDKPQDSSV